MHKGGDGNAWFEEGVRDAFSSQIFRGLCIHRDGVRGWNVYPSMPLKNEVTERAEAKRHP